MPINSKIKTIIIEDEKESQEYLARILSKNFDNIDIVGYAASIKNAIDLINEKKPELIFMDIELTDGYSFEILDKLKKHDFEVIFVTAFDNYIKKAMDHYAISYIIKPFDSGVLVEAISHYVNFKKRVFSKYKHELLTGFLKDHDSSFLIHTGNEHVSIIVSDILKCTADGNYTDFHMVDGKRFLASKSLKYYEKLLISRRFFKVHRSTIINIEHIQSIYKKETIILKNGDKINVSVRNKSNLSTLINALS